MNNWAHVTLYIVACLLIMSAVGFAAMVSFIQQTQEKQVRQLRRSKPACDNGCYPKECHPECQE